MVHIKTLPVFVQNLRDSISVELAGLILFLSGGFLLFNLRSAVGTPWLVQMTGWTAPLVVVGLLLAGIVLVLGRRAGYWSAEALLGGELLLLSLQVGTYIWFHTAPVWNMRLDGSYGGLIGTTLGMFLVRGFGQPMALLLAGIVGLIGGGLLLRYTPLLHFAVWCYQIGVWLQAYWRYMIATYQPRRRYVTSGYGNNSVHYLNGYAALAAERLEQALPRTQNFVSPVGNIYAGYEASSAMQAHGAVARRPAVNGTGPDPRKGKGRKVAPGSLPPLELLAADAGVYNGGDTRAMQQAIEQTLADFDVPVRVVHVESGPTVTQFGVEPLYLEKSGQLAQR